LMLRSVKLGSWMTQSAGMLNRHDATQSLNAAQQQEITTMRNQKNSTPLEWIKFDIDTLPDDLSDKLATFRELESKANAAKREFTKAFEEAAIEAGMGPSAGMEMVISLRFNDISLAYKEKGSTKSSVERVGFNTKTVKPTATRGKNRVLSPSK
jgi:hypothetical protein